MLQKTLITDSSDELRAFLKETSALPEFARACDRLLLFSDQSCGREHLSRRMALIKETVPDIKTVGVTMPGGNITNAYGSGFVGAGYSLLLFERSHAELLWFDCEEMTAEEAGRRFKRVLRYKEHVALTLVFSAGVEKSINQFLTALSKNDRSDIPVIGAQAGSETPFICTGPANEDGVSRCGIAALILYGRGLNLHYSYDMGWRPIGKEMRITGTDGSYAATTIDDRPAVDIYRDYLGVEPDDYFADNVREFPLVTTRGEHEVVRTPSGFGDDGRLDFIAKINKGDTVRLSYGNPRRLVERTRQYADSMSTFGPQAMLLIISENRVRFLKEWAASDIELYRSVMPQAAWVRGYTAVFMDSRGGGVVNAAVLSVGLREGAPSEADLYRPVVLPPDSSGKGAIPLEQRLAMFLERTTHELEDMADAANAANAAKSEFLSMMSHEIRTPINAILGMNELILREAESDDVLRYAENANAAGITLLGIVNDILDFSRIEAGKLEIVPGEYELSSTIGDLVNLIRFRAEEKGLDFKMETADDTPHLLIGDEIRLKQIITNLLTNAVKYTERGEVVCTIGWRRLNESEIALDVAVRDTGTGIKKENLEKLFNAFERLDPERTKRIEGTGIGLNITKRLLDLMGSRLEVRSVYGEGSVFSFSVKQTVVDWEGIGDIGSALKRLKDRRAQKATKLLASGAKILVVDDAPMNLAVISGLLKRTRILVDTADSGAECIGKFAENSYDILFLDHRMPEMDGIETLKELKRRFPEAIKKTPVISLTANAVAGAREEYLAAGFSDYLTKPVMADALEEMIAKYLPEGKYSFVPVEKRGEAEKTKGGLPSWLLSYKELDTAAGVGFCGGNSEYLEALKLFASSIQERSDEIERLYKDGDIENYTVRVHALKSMARSVGATALSELALTLEEAGNNGDTASIDAATPVLLSLYREMIPALKRLDDGADKRRSILIVDDDKDFLALTGRWLKKDYSVMTANSGSEALSRLRSGDLPDLLLLDYEMPQMNGAEVLRAIRADESLSGLSVIFLTGTEDSEHVRAAESLKPDGFLMKTMGKAGLLMGIEACFS